MINDNIWFIMTPEISCQGEPKLHVNYRVQLAEYWLWLRSSQSGMNTLGDAYMILMAKVFVLCLLCFQSAPCGGKFNLRQEFEICFFTMSKTLKERHANDK